MDDVLELDVEENEFDHEPMKGCQRDVEFGGKNCELEQDKFDSRLDPNDYITLCEAKEKLLERLKELEGDSGSNSANKLTKIKKPPVKSRLGIRGTGEDVELMDYSETNDLPALGIFGREMGRECSNRQGDIPRRPSMKKLRKHLRVKWHDSPEKIGKEIAERLEEPKYNLIINAVKVIGGEKAIELFNETKKIQLKGGMYTSSGSRRRTSGGVFLTLLKTKYASEEDVKKIFKEESKQKTQALKQKKALQRRRRRERQKMSIDQESSKEQQMNNKQMQEQ